MCKGARSRGARSLSWKAGPCGMHHPHADWGSVRLLANSLQLAVVLAATMQQHLTHTSAIIKMGSLLVSSTVDEICVGLSMKQSCSIDSRVSVGGGALRKKYAHSSEALHPR